MNYYEVYGFKGGKWKSLGGAIAKTSPNAVKQVKRNFGNKYAKYKAKRRKK